MTKKEILINMIRNHIYNLENELDSLENGNHDYEDVDWEQLTINFESDDFKKLNQYDEKTLNEEYLDYLGVGE